MKCCFSDNDRKPLITSECIVCVSGVHQVALLTHIDKIGPQTAKDVSQVYKSCEIKEMVG